LISKPGKIFVISGPSGSGKTTLARRLLADKKFAGKLARSVSFTTRPKRSGEKNKKDYYFVNEKEFKKQLRAKKILEWTRYLGYYYGTAKEFIDRQLRKARGVILCLDLKGAKIIKRLYPQSAVTIFVLPPSVVELSRRIRKRSSETKKEEIQKRIRLARREIAASRAYDYRIANQDLKIATRRLAAIINQNLIKS
jgi:guanylate kinase